MDLDDIFLSIACTLLLIIGIFGIYVIIFGRPCASIYEYTDLDNNVAQAEDCWSGKGGLVCETFDGTTVQVKNYKIVGSKCSK